MNSGTDYAPIIESLAEMSLEKVPSPEVTIVPHEGPAVGMAIGYYFATHSPSAVMVHTAPGTANSLNNLLNAHSMNVPLFLFAGRTPVTEVGVLGGKDIPVHWGQELRDQGEMLRQFTKWDWEHRFGEQIEEEIVRAYEIAMSDPKGPVYITLPRERISEKVRLRGPARKPKPVEAMAPSKETLQKVADLIVAAESPLIITSLIGREPSASEALIKLSELLSIPVSQNFYYMNYPTTSEMYIGKIGSPLFNDYLRASDLLVLVDVDVPWFPKSVEPDAKCTVIHLDSDPLKERTPTWNFRADIRIRSNPGLALKILNECVLERIGSSTETGSGRTSRRTAVSKDHNSLLERQKKEAIDHKDDIPIDARWLSYCIGTVLDDKKVIFTETVRSPFYEYVPISRVGSAFSTPPFGGLGWSMGTGLGYKLGSPDSDVIVLLGDGSYMYNEPLACHFVSRARKLPFMTIIYNNHAWLASKEPVTKMYPDGSAVRTHNFPGTSLNPSPDFELVAQSCGAYTRRIEKPEEIIPALKDSLEYMHTQKNQVLLNVILKNF